MPRILPIAGLILAGACLGATTTSVLAPLSTNSLRVVNSSGNVVLELTTDQAGAPLILVNDANGRKVGSIDVNDLAARSAAKAELDKNMSEWQKRMLEGMNDPTVDREEMIRKMKEEMQKAMQKKGFSDADFDFDFDSDFDSDSSSNSSSDSSSSSDSKSNRDSKSATDRKSSSNSSSDRKSSSNGSSSSSRRSSGSSSSSSGGG